MAAVSVGTARVRQQATVTVSGASTNTSYVLRIAHPGGFTESHTIKTDGSGNATQTYVPQEAGNATIDLDPVPTSSGSTASTTVTHIN